MAAHAFDVVVVPDFSDSVARRFEIMTLFFLASWMEFAGRSRDLPLHIACIGEAPESVRSLAARCGAEISSHRPLLGGEFVNKLRGFEVNRQTDHVLLLDSDMLILSEFHELSCKLGGDCIAAAASNGATMLSREKWRKIYAVFGMPCPENEVIPLNRELDTFQCAPYRDKKKFLPYYNGGVVYAPWRSKLGEVWQNHLIRIFDIAPHIMGPMGKVSNQPSLATAIAHLQLQGFDFQLLPAQYHVRWQHIATGAVSSRQTRLLHTVGFGRWSSMGNANTAEQEIEIYHSNTLKLTKKLRSHRGPFTRLAHLATRRPQVRDCHRVHRLMRTLYEKYVRELKR